MASPPEFHSSKKGFSEALPRASFAAGYDVVEVVVAQKESGFDIGDSSKVSEISKFPMALGDQGFISFLGDHVGSEAQMYLITASGSASSLQGSVGLVSDSVPDPASISSGKSSSSVMGSDSSQGSVLVSGLGKAGVKEASCSEGSGVCDVADVGLVQSRDLSISDGLGVQSVSGEALGSVSSV